MKASVISIGNEIVSGSIVDTNGAYVSKGLQASGFHVVAHAAVPDTVDAIVSALEHTAEFSDLIVVTGGLGPTTDDVTGEALCSYLGKGPVVNRDWAGHLEKRWGMSHGTLSPRQISQATMPEGTRILENEVGSACGFMTTDPPVIAVLPGVPSEMKRMFDAHLIPLLRRSSEEIILTRSVKTLGLPESQVDDLLGDLVDPAGNPAVGITVQTGIVKVTASVRARDLKEAESVLDRLESQFRERLGFHIFAVDSETLEGIVALGLTDNQLTLAVAESCTGGLITNLLTDVPGISASLLLGVVAYSNEAKSDLLGVPQEMIDKHGAVSKEVAERMASGVRNAARSDFGLAVTGIAGPGGGSEHKPVGLVYIALDGPEGATVEEFHLHGGRSGVKMRAANAALDMLRKALQR